jgi:hypothetical protein
LPCRPCKSIGNARGSRTMHEPRSWAGSNTHPGKCQGKIVAAVARGDAGMPAPWAKPANRRPQPTSCPNTPSAQSQVLQQAWPRRPGKMWLGLTIHNGKAAGHGRAFVEPPSHPKRTCISSVRGSSYGRPPLHSPIPCLAPLAPGALPQACMGKRQRTRVAGSHLAVEATVEIRSCETHCRSRGRWGLPGAHAMVHLGGRLQRRARESVGILGSPAAAPASRNLAFPAVQLSCTCLRQWTARCPFGIAGSRWPGALPSMRALGGRRAWAAGGHGCRPRSRLQRERLRPWSLGAGRGRLRGPAPYGGAGDRAPWCGFGWMSGGLSLRVHEAAGEGSRHRRRGGSIRSGRSLVRATDSQREGRLRSMPLPKPAGQLASPSAGWLGSQRQAPGPPTRPRWSDGQASASKVVRHAQAAVSPGPETAWPARAGFMIWQADVRWGGDRRTDRARPRGVAGLCGRADGPSVFAGARARASRGGKETRAGLSADGAKPARKNGAGA